MEQLLDMADLAELLGVRLETVHVYSARGLLPEPTRMFGRSPAWTPEVIEEWIETRPGRGHRAQNVDASTNKSSSGSISRRSRKP